ncbi:MAG TPA: dienelactone hydrolase family protein, partial [Lacibacter sp.]|nr:dienelactone hydrolase family protein [Lacibacter sp.]
METTQHLRLQIRAGKVLLPGDLMLPPEWKGLILFSHGSGSSSHSPRNQMVASFLRKQGFGTLLFDLLTPEEDRYADNRFNIDLLTQRLISATLWVERLPEVQHAPLGYFGASTGAASALRAAVQLPQVQAVVCRGGRPDMATDELPRVEAPVLLLAGGLDTDVLRLNEQAFARLRCTKELQVIPGATHLFEEPGKLA